MKLGTITVYKKWQKLKTIVNYQTPKRPTFFEYTVLNAIAHYPDKALSLRDILKNELQILNSKIYTNVLKELIEKENIIEINSKVSAQYLNSNYANLEWIDSAIGMFTILPEALVALEHGFLVSKNNNREVLIDFLSDDFANIKYVNNNDIKLVETVDFDDLVLSVSEQRSIFGDELYQLLEKYKTKGGRYNPFSLDTVFSSIRMGNVHIENTNQKLDNIFQTEYEEKRVILSLTTFKDLKISIQDDSLLQTVIEQNSNLQSRVIDFFLQKMGSELKANFNMNISKVDPNFLDDNFQQDPRQITPTIINPQFLFINGHQIKETAIVEQGYYKDNGIKCIIVVNATRSTTLEDINGQIPMFYLRDSQRTITDLFLLQYANGKNHNETYLLQETELIMLQKKLITASRYVESFSNELFVKLKDYLELILQELNDKIYELIHHNWISELLIHIYLIDIINNNEVAFNQFITKIKTNEFNNKAKIWDSCERVVTNFVLKPNYLHIIHKMLVGEVLVQAVVQNNIVKSYQVLAEYELMGWKDILKSLQDVYHNDNVTLKELLELSTVAPSNIVDKIWNQNLFQILTKTFFALNNDQINREVLSHKELISHNRNNALITNIWTYCQDFVKYQNEMTKKETSNLQRYWITIWENINRIKEKLSNNVNGEELVLQMLESLSLLENKFKEIKYGVIYYGPEKYQKYLEQCEFAKAANNVIVQLDDKISKEISKTIQNIKYTNEKIEFCKKLISKESYKKIFQLYTELKLYVYCEKSRDERNDNNNRLAINQIKIEVEEVLS